MLERIPRFQIIGAAGFSPKLIHLIKIGRPTVAVYWLEEPWDSKFPSAVRLIHSFPQLPVLIISSCVTHSRVRDALRVGAVGYVCAKSSVVELEHGIVAACQGNRFITSQLSKTFEEPADLNADGQVLKKTALTERQLQILQAICQSKNTKEVAILLQVSPKTVEYHRRQLMSRLGTNNVAGVVRRALALGLISL